MAPRWLKVWRDAWEHKARTGLVVLAITVGSLGAGTVLDTWSLLRHVTREEYRASNPASATIRTAAVDTTLLQRVAAMPAIGAVQARRTVIASARVQGAWKTAVLFATTDFASMRIGVVKPEGGAWPPPEGALVVEASSVDFAVTAVGESLTVQLQGGEPHTLPVAGIARDVGLAPGWMEHVVYLFVTPATLGQLGASLELDELQFVAATPGLDHDAVRRIAKEVCDVIESTGREIGHVDVPVPGRHIHAAQIGSLLFTQGAFGVLCMLMSGILVVNLITAMLAGQVREIGVMKAVGARSIQIAAMYLCFALGLGLLACAIAIPAAAFLGRAYARFTADLLNFDIAGFAIPARVILVQLAVGALLPVAAAAIPVARGCRIPVAEALRDFGIHGTNRSGKGGVLGAGGLTRPVLFSLRNAFRRRQRMALTLLTLAAGGAVYLGALDLRAAIRGSVGLLFSSQRFDVALRLSQSWPADTLEAAVGHVPGVARTEAWGGTRAALAGPGDILGDTFSLAAPPAATQMFAPVFLSGRWARPEDGNGLVVNRRLVESAPALAVGSEVSLLLGGRPTPWKVVGIVDTGLSRAAYTCRETLARVNEDARVDRAVIASTAQDPAALLEFVRSLREDLESRGMAVESSHLMEESRRVMEDHLLMVAGFLGVMGQLMIVVGGLGLASTMSLAVIERTREIGVLRAIGARHRIIIMMVQLEAAVVALLSWAIAIPLSLPMSAVLGHAFGRIMLPVPLSWAPQTTGVLQWLGLVLVVSVLAAAWPAYRATRVATASALAYE